MLKIARSLSVSRVVWASRAAGGISLRVLGCTTATPSFVSPFANLQTRGFAKKKKKKKKNHLVEVEVVGANLDDASDGGADVKDDLLFDLDDGGGGDDDLEDDDFDGAGVGDLVDLDEVKSRMQHVLERLQQGLAGLRGGKADPGMFDNILVDSYGSEQPLSQVGQVTLKSPTLAIINVFDPAIAPAVASAIRNAELNLNPIAEATVIKVPIPKASQETREAMAKLAGQRTEKSKQWMRRIRRDAMDALKSMKEGMSEDDVFRHGKKVDALTEEFVGEATKLLKAKTSEIAP